MHSTFDVAVYLAVAVFFSTAIGWVACAVIAGRRERLDALQLAERADANGRQLINIARGLRGLLGPIVDHRETLDCWALDLEAIAVAHLECVNAIGIDALRAVNPGRPQYLGEFRRASRLPPALDPTPSDVPRDVSSHRQGHRSSP